MQKDTVLKLNRAGQGYNQQWLEVSTPLDLPTVDNALPPVDDSRNQPYLAFSITPLGSNQALIAVGCFWPQYPDEFGRRGLSLWHGVYCDWSGDDGDPMIELSALLAGLVSQYESRYEPIGTLAAALAVDNHPEIWPVDLEMLTMVRSIPLDPSYEKVVHNFRDSLEHLPSKANIRVSASANRLSIVPLLVCLALYRSPVGRSVASGTLSQRELGRLQHVSVPFDVPGFTTIDPLEITVMAGATSHAGMAQSNVSACGQRDLLLGLPPVVFAGIASLSLILLAVTIIRLWPPGEIPGLKMEVNSQRVLAADRHQLEYFIQVTNQLSVDIPQVNLEVSFPISVELQHDGAKEDCTKLDGNTVFCPLGDIPTAGSSLSIVVQIEGDHRDEIIANFTARSDDKVTELRSP